MQFSFTYMTFYGIFYLLSIRINGKLFSNTRVTQRSRTMLDEADGIL